MIYSEKNIIFALEYQLYWLISTLLAYGKGKEQRQAPHEEKIGGDAIYFLYYQS